jgi:hypothetical protein
MKDEHSPVSRTRFGCPKGQVVRMRDESEKRKDIWVRSEGFHLVTPDREYIIIKEI